jgi:hypothetical protein
LSRLVDESLAAYDIVILSGSTLKGAGDLCYRSVALFNDPGGRSRGHYEESGVATLTVAGLARHRCRRQIGATGIAVEVRCRGPQYVDACF